MSPMKCPHCGSIFTPPPGVGFVTCPACGAGSWVGETAAQAAPVAQNKAARSIVIVVVIACAGLLVFGCVLSFALGSFWASATGEWYSAACLVDANGDGALDLAGFGERAGADSRQLQLIDGATGRRIWSGPTFSTSAKVLCVSRSHFAVDDVDFNLRIFSARAPQHPAALRLADHVRQVGRGRDCVTLDLLNNDRRQLAFDGSNVARCESEAPSYDFGGGPFMSPIETERTIIVGGDQYTVSRRDPGTPFLSVVRSRAGVTVWRRDLRYIQAEGGFGFTATPHTLFVWGADPRDDNVGFAIGLDLDTGAQRFAISQESTWSGMFQLQAPEFNGRYVIMSWGFGLHAYDPDTGRRAWHIGGR